MIFDVRVEWAVAEMRRRSAEPLCLEALARHVNLSHSRFAHVFRQNTGQSPGRFLRDLRLERARELLESSFMSVKEVMAAAGFNDPSHFTRSFHQTFGLCPSEWRKRLTSTPPRSRGGGIGQVTAGKTKTMQSPIARRASTVEACDSLHDCKEIDV